MKTNNLNRWSKLTVNNKVINNRVVVPPMASGTADLEGFATAATINHYKRLTDARAGLLIVEYTSVHPTGRSEVNQLGIQSDAHIEGLAKISQLIRKSGAIAGIQLTHGGGKTEKELTGGFLMGPSAIAVPVKDQDLVIPDPMSKDEIEMWKVAFITASDRAVAAGFDLIEIHSAHGYGLNQFLSPITNQRVDEYGKDINGRMRLLLEIVNAIRIKHPSLLISVRMPGQDFIEDGLTISDTIAIAQSLEKAGVDIIHVSSGIGGWRRSPTRAGEGYLVDEAIKIQAAVSIPVIGVGGIQTGEYIDQRISSGQFSLAAVGRAILDNPKSWYESVLVKKQFIKEVPMFTKFKTVTILWALLLTTSVVAREGGISISSTNPSSVAVSLTAVWSGNSYDARLAHRLFLLAKQSGATVYESYAKTIILTGDQPASDIRIRVYENGTQSVNEGVFFSVPVTNFQPPHWYGYGMNAFKIAEDIILFSGAAAKTLYLMLDENVKRGFLKKTEYTYLGGGGSGMIHKTTIDDTECISCNLQVAKETRANYYECTFKLSRN